MSLNFETIEPLNGDQFNIEFQQGQDSVCKLIEVKKSPSVESSFSLIFESDSPEIYEQSIYKITHKNLGDMELFLVPVNGDDKSVQYEAIFT